MNPKTKTELKKRYGVWLARHSDVFDGHFWYVQNLMSDLLNGNNADPKAITLEEVKEAIKRKKEASEGARHRCKSTGKVTGRQVRALSRAAKIAVRALNKAR